MAAVSSDEKVVVTTTAVRTEFVLVDSGATGTSSVFLSGDWNDWNLTAMKYSAPSPCRSMDDSGLGCFEVITSVPAGYHEFSFVVDGEWKLSERHPRTADLSANWRFIRGAGGRHSSRARAFTERLRAVVSDDNGTLDERFVALRTLKELIQMVIGIKRQEEPFLVSEKFRPGPLVYLGGAVLIYMILYYTVFVVGPVQLGIH